jgi:hypothetical protein
VNCSREQLVAILERCPSNSYSKPTRGPVAETLIVLHKKLTNSRENLEAAHKWAKRIET